MDEQRPGEGGAANTPPFPRLVSDDDVAEPNLAPAVPADTSVEAEPEEVETRVVAEAIARPVIGDASAAAEAPTGETDASLVDRPGDPNGRREPLSEDLRRLAGRAGEEVRRKAERRVSRGFERFADRLDEAADRIEQLAETQLHGDGARSRAADAAHGASGLIEETASYLRSHDLRSMKADLERQVREKPLQTLLAALGTGWLLGKIMR